MAELTLESLAARVAELERKLADATHAPTKVIPPSRDWRSVVGISEDNEFTRLMQAEIDANSDAERRAALHEDEA